MTPKKPLISAIVVTYQRLEFLKRSIDAILLQSFKNLEIIVVSDGYEGETENYILSLNNSKITYQFISHCGYPAKARNHGVSKANGHYLAFCDDDDLWMPEKLEVQLRTIQKEKTKFCATLRTVIDEDDELIKTNPLRWVPNSITFNSLIWSNSITYSSVLVEKTLVEKYGCFIDDIAFKAVEDYHLWLKMAFFGERLILIKKPLVLYRVHSKNITSKLSVGVRRNRRMFEHLSKEINISVYQKLKIKIVLAIKTLTYSIRIKK